MVSFSYFFRKRLNFNEHYGNIYRQMSEIDIEFIPYNMLKTTKIDQQMTTLF